MENNLFYKEYIVFNNMKYIYIYIYLANRKYIYLFKYVFLQEEE
jgi:hypothetical protein